MKNKKMIIAIVALVVVVAVFAGVYLATRPETAAGGKTFTVTVVHKDESTKEFIYTTDAESEPVTALPTKDAFAATAKDFLAAEMGLNVSEEYEISAPFLDAVGRPTISMIRVIHGYKTDDDIAVWLNDRGEVDAVNAIRFGSLDAAAKGLAKELLDQAHSLVRERIADAKLPQGYEMKEPYLTTNNEGRVFLSVPLAYTTADGVNCGDIVSINVN